MYLYAYIVLLPLLLMFCVLLYWCCCCSSYCRCLLLVLAGAVHHRVPDDKFGAGSLNLISGFYFSPFTHELFSMYPLAAMSQLSPRLAYTLGNYRHARSQGGRQPAAANFAWILYTYVIGGTRGAPPRWGDACRRSAYAGNGYRCRNGRISRDRKSDSVAKGSTALI